MVIRYLFIELHLLLFIQLCMELFSIPMGLCLLEKFAQGKLLFKIYLINLLKIIKFNPGKGYYVKYFIYICIN